MRAEAAAAAAAAVDRRDVAESADGWNTFFMPLEAYRHKLEALTEHCAAVGRDPGAIRKSLVFPTAIGATDADVRERTERVARAYGIPVEEVPSRVLVGTPERAAEQILRYVELGVGDVILGVRAPVDYATVQLFIEQVAPLVRRAATPAAAR